MESGPEAYDVTGQPMFAVDTRPHIDRMDSNLDAEPTSPTLSQEQTVPRSLETPLNASRSIFHYIPNSSRRRRATGSLLTRSTATPGRSTHMHKMWIEAHDALRREMVTMSSPVKISSSTPAFGSTTKKRRASRSLAEDMDTVGLSYFKDLHNTTDFLDDSPTPLLPLPTNFSSDRPLRLDFSTAEPMSSGFSSPAARPTSKVENAELVMTVPTSKDASTKQLSSSPDNSSGSSEMFTSSYGVPLPYPMSERELEERLQATSISEVDAWLSTVLDESLPQHPESTRKEPTRGQKAKGSTSPIESSPIVTVGRAPNFEITGDEYAQIESMPAPLRPASRAESNKENIQPSSSNPLPIPEPGLYPKEQSHARSVASQTLAHRSTQTPIQRNTSRKVSWTPASSMRHLVPTSRALSETPQGYFSLPPRRKKLKASTSLVSHAHGPSKGGDEVEDGLPELSPHVTPFRKGKGPKKARTPSYFDVDILPEVSPFKLGGGDEGEEGGSGGKGKRSVLVDHPMSDELVKGKAFVEEAEGGVFGGV